MGIAWVFPGQGSQKVGMVGDLLELPGARERFAAASELLGRDLLAICAGEPLSDPAALADLNDTRNSQPALFVLESLLVDALKEMGRSAHLVAGHSLGELVALYAAGVFDLEAGLALMRQRSELMAAAGGGAMTAVIGFNRAELEERIAASEGVVIANDNSASQVVLSGSSEAVQVLCQSISCKRAIPLAVSGAFHSPFMAEAAAAFRQLLEQVPFADATIPVLSNTDPTPATDGAILKERLSEQMVTGVRWRETMDQLPLLAIDTVVEIGPGNVLTGLLRRAVPDLTTAQIGAAADLAR
jgi:[acyl-carrier-protein] S-malonyltransferase